MFYLLSYRLKKTQKPQNKYAYFSHQNTQRKCKFLVTCCIKNRHFQDMKERNNKKKTSLKHLKIIMPE